MRVCRLPPLPMLVTCRIEGAHEGFEALLTIPCHSLERSFGYEARRDTIELLPDDSAHDQRNEADERIRPCPGMEVPNGVHQDEAQREDSADDMEGERRVEEPSARASHSFAHGIPHTHGHQQERARDGEGIP